jgi:hypothetical protein
VSNRGREGVAVGLEGRQTARRVDAVFDRPARHQPARAFGEEADDLVATVLPVLEHAVDDTRLQGGPQCGAGVFDRRQVHDHGRARAGQPFVQVRRQRIAPEGVEVLAATRGQCGAHLQPVGLQPVQRAQHTVQARQDHQVLLGPAEFGRRQRARLQAGVDVAVERQQGRLAVDGGGRG